MPELNRSRRKRLIPVPRRGKLLLTPFRRVLNALGLDVVRFPISDTAHQQATLLNHFGIDVVLDVGANVGQYASGLRARGYSKAIISVEPLADAYHTLSVQAAMDPAWLAFNVALGTRDGEAVLNVSGNSVSSSLRGMSDRHTTAAPQSIFIGTQVVPVTTVDAIMDRYGRDYRRPFLKVDVQGAERDVLEGALQSMPTLMGVQLELSLVSLYDDSLLLRDGVDYMNTKGFELVSLQPGFMDPRTCELLQCDGIFFRPDSKQN